MCVRVDKRDGSGPTMKGAHRPCTHTSAPEPGRGTAARGKGRALLPWPVAGTAGSVAWRGDTWGPAAAHLVWRDVRRQVAHKLDKGQRHPAGRRCRDSCEGWLCGTCLCVHPLALSFPQPLCKHQARLAWAAVGLGHRSAAGRSRRLGQSGRRCRGCRREVRAGRAAGMSEGRPLLFAAAAARHSRCAP